MQKTIIGLTGNIASGKSEVEKIFKKNNIPVLDADDIVKDLLKPNTTCYKKIINNFKLFTKYLPITIPGSDQLNKQKLRNIIYTDKKQKTIIESIIHPEVQKQMQEFANDFLNNKTSSNLCVLSIPLLFNKNNYKFINKILYIDIDPQKQLSRLIKRDNITQNLASKMIQAQPSRDTRLKQCDIFINNNSNIKSLERKISSLIRSIQKTI